MGTSESRSLVLHHLLKLSAATAGCCLLVYASPWGDALNVWANSWVAETNVELLRSLGVDATVDGTFIHTGAFSVLIVDRCNGLMALVLAVPACLTLPCATGMRLVGAGLSVVGISAFNQVRLVVEMLFGSLHPEHYATLERIWMRALFALVFSSALWGWISVAVRVSKERHA
jgi:hypothetical protein